MKAGVAISPDTPSQAISEEVGTAADMLLVMTVYPGRYKACPYYTKAETLEPRSGRAEILRSLRS